MKFALKYKSYLTVDGCLISAKPQIAPQRCPATCFPEACAWLTTTDLPYGMVWAVELPETAPETFRSTFDIDDPDNNKTRPADQLLPEFAVYAEMGRELGFWPVVHYASSEMTSGYWIVLYKEEPTP